MIRGKTRDEWRKRVTEDERALDAARNRVTEAAHAYGKTPIGRLDRATGAVAKGMRKVATFFDDIVKD